MEKKELRERFEQIYININQMKAAELNANLEQMEISILCLSSGVFDIDFLEETSVIDGLVNQIRREVRKMEYKLIKREASK